MKYKRIALFGFLAVAVSAGHYLATEVMIAKAVSPPHSNTLHLLKLAFRPQYEIRAPHRSLWQELKISVVPTAYACGGAECDGTQSMKQCQNGCPGGMCGNCPDCYSGPCTIYACVPSGNPKTLCVSTSNTSCPLCADSHGTKCTFGGCTGNQCP